MGWYIEQLIVTMLGLLILIANVLILLANLDTRSDLERMANALSKAVFGVTSTPKSN